MHAIGVVHSVGAECSNTIGTFRRFETFVRKSIIFEPPVRILAFLFFASGALGVGVGVNHKSLGD